MIIFQKILNSILRATKLKYGYEQTPQYVTAGTTYTAPIGSCFYMVQPLGENATIDTAKDLDGTTISGLSGAVIPVGRTLLGRFSTLKFTAPSASCTIVLSQRIITDLQ